VEKPRLERAALLVAGALAAFVALRFELVFDVSLFLPAAPDTRVLRHGDASRTLTLLIESADAPHASQHFERALRADPELMDEVTDVRGGPPPGIERALWNLYAPHVAALTDDELSTCFARLRQRLAEPTSTLLARAAPRDPCLTIPGLLAAQAAGLHLQGGRFVSADGGHAILFVFTRASGFDGAVQSRILAAIDGAFARVNPGPWKLRKAGVAPAAVRAEAGIRRDMQRVAWSFCGGLLLLLIVVFRSLRIVLLTVPVLACGALCGLAATLALWGRVHGLTLAFGASLLGVAVDYTVHLYCHQAHLGGPAQDTRARIWPGLSLGALTTVAGFIGLFVSGLPGLQEVACFSAAGILGALGATYAFGPLLLPRARATRWTLRLRRPRAVVVASVLVILAGLPGLTWDDALLNLTHRDPRIAAEEAFVRARATPFESRRLVLASGADEEAALRANERANAALLGAVAAGDLTAFRSLSPWLPSARTQRTRRARTHDLAQAAAAQGFRPEAFAPFAALLAAPSPVPLSFADLAASPLGAIVRPLRVDLPQETVFITLLQGAAPGLAAHLKGIEGVRLFDEARQLAAAAVRFRKRTTVGLALGAVAVLWLLWRRYRRRYRRLGATFVPAALATLVALSALSLAGIALNLVALTALLMVFSLGVDYAVFVTEADAQSMDATVLAVWTSWATTLLGFGLLAWSEHPALQTIGITASVGVTASFLLSLPPQGQNSSRAL
jgi:predicted exporter